MEPSRASNATSPGPSTASPRIASPAIRATYQEAPGHLESSFPLTCETLSHRADLGRMPSSPTTSSRLPVDTWVFSASAVIRRECSKRWCPTVRPAISRTTTRRHPTSRATSLRPASRAMPSRPGMMKRSITHSSRWKVHTPTCSVRRVTPPVFSRRSRRTARRATTRTTSRRPGTFRVASRRTVPAVPHGHDVAGRDLRAQPVPADERSRDRHLRPVPYEWDLRDDADRLCVLPPVGLRCGAVPRGEQLPADLRIVPRRHDLG